jgi:hypothetical protein
MAVKKPKRAVPVEKKTKKKAGRKKTNLDWEYIDKLLEAGCKGAAIADHHAITRDSFYKRCVEDKGMSFREYATKKKLDGDDILRYAQWDEAVNKRNPRLLIRLGELRINQNENVVDLVSAGGVTIVNFSETQICPWKDKEKSDLPKGEGDDG